MNKDAQLIAEAYEALLEAKKKLSPAQKKIAQQAPPPDEITGDDFKALKGKKKELKEEVEDVPSFEKHSVESIYNAVKGGMSLEDFAIWVKSAQEAGLSDPMASIEAKRAHRIASNPSLVGNRDIPR